MLSAQVLVPTLPLFLRWHASEKQSEVTFHYAQQHNPRLCNSLTKKKKKSPSGVSLGVVAATHWQISLSRHCQISCLHLPKTGVNPFICLKSCLLFWPVILHSLTNVQTCSSSSPTLLLMPSMQLVQPLPPMSR